MGLPASDTFTDTNGVQLTTHSSNWTLNNGGGDGDFDIQSNSLAVDEAAGVSDFGAHWNADAFNNDQYAQATFINVGAASYGIGVATRCASGSTITYYYLVSDEWGGDGTKYLAKMVSGAYTAITSNGTEYENGDVIRLESEGTTLTPKLNGSTDAGLGAQTDSSIASGSAGVAGYGDGTNLRIDNWEGGNLGGGGGDPEGSLIGGKLLRGGLLGHGVLVRG